jgi:hypothetical protein
MHSLQQLRGDVQREFERALIVAEGDATRRLGLVEGAIWTTLLSLGRALVALYLARAAARPRTALYEYGGREYMLASTAVLDVGTRFGKVAFSRPVGRAKKGTGGGRDFPVDRELGLCAGFSLGVVTGVAKLTAQMAFGAARRAFLDVYEWAPSPRAILRMVDGVAARARSFIDWAPPPEDDGEVMVILADGKGAPTISSTELSRRRQRHGERAQSSGRATRKARRKKTRANKPRREPGDKSKNAKMAAVGVIYTLRREGDHLEGPLNKRVYGTFVSYRALFEWLAKEAKKRGLGTDRISKVLFVGDGAKVLWDLQREFFPQADMCLDWYHVVEKLWAAGKALIRNDRRRLDLWVAEQKRRLREGKLDEILQLLRTGLDATPRTGPGNKGRRIKLTKTIAHFTANALRMEYGRLRGEDLDIGSGVAEGAVRHVVGMRQDGPGMRWGRHRMEAVLQLRCILVNGQWNDFTDYLEREERVVLPAVPVATRAYDAKRKEAA